MILKNPNKYGFNSYIPSSKAFSHGVTSLLYASTGWAQGLQVCHWHIRIGSLAKTEVNCCNTKKNKHQKIVAGSCQTWEKKTTFPFSVHFCILRTCSCQRSNSDKSSKEKGTQETTQMYNGKSMPNVPTILHGANTIQNHSCYNHTNPCFAAFWLSKNFLMCAETKHFATRSVWLAFFL